MRLLWRYNCTIFTNFYQFWPIFIIFWSNILLYNFNLPLNVINPIKTEIWLIQAKYKEIGVNYLSVKNWKFLNITNFTEFWLSIFLTYFFLITLEISFFSNWIKMFKNLRNYIYVIYWTFQHDSISILGKTKITLEDFFCTPCIIHLLHKTRDDIYLFDLLLKLLLSIN